MSGTRRFVTDRNVCPTGLFPPAVNDNTSGACGPSLQPIDQRSNAPSGRALGVKGKFFLRIRNARNIQMRPRHIARDEKTQKRPTLKGRSFAAGGVDDVARSPRM